MKDLLQKEWVRTALCVSGLLVVYVLLASVHITDTFFRVNEDTNGTNGIGALNMAEHGFFDMKLGNHLQRVNSPDDIEGSYYTNHPVGFLIPSAALLNIFGQSEAAARIGPLLFMVVGIGFFYVALERLFDDRKKALFAVGVMIVLPATIFYGKHLDMQAPALGMMMVVYAMFVLYWLLESRNTYIGLLVSIVLGGLVSWFFYFLPAAIWTYVAFAPSMKNFERRRQLLVAIPLILVVTIGLNVWHAYILNGSQAFDNYHRAFFLRSSFVPFNRWAADFYEAMRSGITGVFLAVSVIGTGIFCSVTRKEENNTLLIPMLIAPLLLMVVFKQWVLHPFGQVFFLPAVGLLVMTAAWYVYERFGIMGMYGVIAVVLFGLYSSHQHLTEFYEKRRIIADKDIEFIQNLSTQVHDGQVCITDNELGINMTGILHWYLGHTTSDVSTCLEPDDTIVMPINPELDESSTARISMFEDAGFTGHGCAELYCAMLKPEFAKKFSL